MVKLIEVFCFARFVAPGGLSGCLINFDEFVEVINKVLIFVPV